MTHPQLTKQYVEGLAKETQHDIEWLKLLPSHSPPYEYQIKQVTDTQERIIAALSYCSRFLEPVSDKRLWQLFELAHAAKQHPVEAHNFKDHQHAENILFLEIAYRQQAARVRELEELLRPRALEFLTTPPTAASKE